MEKREPFRGVSWTGAIDVQAQVGRCPYGSNYRKGCKCDTCRATVAKYMSNYRRRQAEKEWGVASPTELVDAAPTVAIIKYAYLKRRVKLNEISRVTGVKKDTIGALRHNRRKKITKATADRIAEMYGDAARAPRSFVPNQLEPFSKHSWKVYGLLAQGWTLATLKTQTTADAGWLDHIADKTSIQYQHVQQLDALVLKVGDRHGPSKSNVKRMENRGYFPLIHYREDGMLIIRSLLPEQREALERVQSKHGEPSGSADGHGSRTRRRRGR